MGGEEAGVVADGTLGAAGLLGVGVTLGTEVVSEGEPGAGVVVAERTAMRAPAATRSG